MEAIRNFAGGYDLLTEKDAGNEVLITTGNIKNSILFWKEVRRKAEIVLSELRTEETDGHIND